MVPRSVDWGSASPNITNATSSLGEFLGSVASGGGGRNALAAERAQSSIAVNNARIQQIMAQQEKSMQEAEEQRIKNDQLNEQWQTTNDAGVAAGEAAANALPHPPLVLSPNEPAIVQYNADTNKIRNDAKYIYQGGGNADARSKGAGGFQANQDIQYGGPDAFIRGRGLNGQSVDSKDYVPGAPMSYNSPAPAPVPVDSFNNQPGSAARPIFNKDKTMQLVPDKDNPGAYKQVPVAGVTAGANNQEAIDAVDRAKKAYGDLSHAGGIGPWYGSEWGRAAGHYLNTENSKLRDEYEAARNKLILMERQRLMRGQGAVSDKDAAQIENMFPKFDANDPEVGIRTLDEMSRRLHAGQNLYDPKGENGPLPPEANAGGGQTTQAPAPGARLAKDGFYYLQDPADGSWHRVVPNGGQ